MRSLLGIEYTVNGIDDDNEDDDEELTQRSEGSCPRAHST